jgi:hypothetical protein
MARIAMMRAQHRHQPKAICPLEPLSRTAGLTLHASGAYLIFAQAGADLFAYSCLL